MMPSVSKKQHNFMEAIAHSPSFAKKAGVPQSVGKDFNQADKGRKFSKGGTMATKDSGFDDDVKRVKDSLYMNEGEDRMSSRERGLGPEMAGKRLRDRGVDLEGLVGNRANAEDLGDYKKGGKVKKMNMGGYADGKGKMAKGGMAHEDVKMDKKMMQKAVNKHEGRLHKGESMTKLAKGGSAKFMSFSEDGKPAGMKSVKKMASGGSFRASANGIATKGKTKGTMVKMSTGGKAC
jgi:hypothetical protein